MDDNKQKVREFLARYTKTQQIADDDDIFALGFVNSMVAMQLIGFIERDLGVPVADEDLDLDNFRTIARIDDFISRKSAVAT